MKYFLVCSLVWTLFVSNTGCEFIYPNESRGELFVSDTDSTLVTTSWHLIAFEENKTRIIDIERPPASSSHYSLEFTETTADTCGSKNMQGEWKVKLVGFPNSSPCTSYEIDPHEKTIQIYVRGTTFAEIPSDSYEKEFFKALIEANSYERNAEVNRLRIFYSDSKSMLFEAIEN